MKDWARFSGIAGVVVLAFGLLAVLTSASFGQIGTFFFGGSVNYLSWGQLLLGVTLLALWFAFYGAKNLDRANAAVTGRQARFGANALLYATVFFGLIVVINMIAGMYNKRWDLTEEGVYSLSSQSRQIVSALKKPLKIVYIKGARGGESGEDQNAEELLKLFKYHGGEKVSYELLDPRAKPHLIEKYGFQPGQFLYIGYGGEGEQKPVETRINQVSEEAVTNAIVKLVRGEARKIYYVTGHGEPELKSMQENGIQILVDAMKDEQLNLESILLAQQQKIPDDAAAVLLVAPKRALRAEERDMLVAYGQNGGRLVLMTDPRAPEDVRVIADKFGIKVGEDVIIEPVVRLFMGPQLAAQPIIQTFTPSGVTKNMSEQTPVLLTIASSVTSAGSPKDGATVTELMKTSPNAWAHKNLAEVFDAPEPKVTRTAEDINGPVAVAALYERRQPTVTSGDQNKPEGQTKGGENVQFDKVSRVIVFGDSDFALNGSIGMYSNRDLVLNALNYVVGEEGGVSIRPRQLRSPREPIPQDVMIKLFTTSFLLPELVLLFGLYIWWRRKTLEVA